MGRSGQGAELLYRNLFPEAYENNCRESVHPLTYSKSDSPLRRCRCRTHTPVVFVCVCPQFSSRPDLIETTRSVLNRYIPHIYLYSDVYKRRDFGNSPGYALSLLTESTTGVLLCSEAMSIPRAPPNQSAASSAKVGPDRLRRDGRVVYSAPVWKREESQR